MLHSYVDDSQHFLTFHCFRCFDLSNMGTKLATWNGIQCVSERYLIKFRQSGVDLVQANKSGQKITGVGLRPLQHADHSMIRHPEYRQKSDTEHHITADACSRCG